MSPYEANRPALIIAADRLLPNIASTAKTTTMLGSEPMTSTTPEMMRSPTPLEYPATRPNTTPTTPKTAVASSAPASAGRPPQSSRESTSRPSVSVPSQYWPPGSCST